MGEDDGTTPVMAAGSAAVRPEPEESPPFSVVPDPATAGGDLRKLGVLGGVLALVSVIFVLRRRSRTG